MAIAFDTATVQVFASGASPQTWSHTCTGTNLVLLVFLIDQSATATGITYNGVAMTSLISGTSSGGSPYSCWGLVNPATGAHTVSVAYTGTTTVRGFSASYSGVKQTGLPDASTAAGASSSASPFSHSITTVADSSWIVAACDEEAGVASSMTAGTNMTSRQTNVSVGNFALMIGDTNGPITPAGSTSQSFSWAGGAGFPNIIQISLAPAGAAGTTNPAFLLKLI